MRKTREKEQNSRELQRKMVGETDRKAEFVSR